MMLSHKFLAGVVQRSYGLPASFVAGETECRLESVGSKLVFAFRGTETTGNAWESKWQNLKSRVVDTLNDVRFWPKDYEGIGKLHRGFAEGLGGGGFGLAEKVIEQLPIMMDKAEIVCTGHSKGASECQAFAAAMILRGYNVTQVVAFAPAKVFVGETDALRGAAVTLYRHGNDVVTELPLGMAWDYKHYVELTQLGPEYKKRMFPRLIRDWKWHSMDHYEKLVTG